MRKIMAQRPIPTTFKPIFNSRVIDCVAEGDIGILQSRLKAKCLIFADQKSLRKFWLTVLAKSDLGKHCLGAVNALKVFWENPTTGAKSIEYDPKYFAIIGLIKGHLTMEIITHESVHAAFAYADRIGNRHKWPRIDECVGNINFEETICYPTGIIATGIAKLARRHKLI